MGYNKTILVGNLTKDCELRYTKNGKAVCNFTIACTTGFGEKAKTLFARCVCFGKTAEAVEKYTSKGSSLLVDGELQIRSYEKDHTTHWITEIITFNVQFLGGKSKQNQEPVDKQIQLGEDIPF